MTVESQPVIPSTTAILRRVQPPRSMTGRTAGYAPRAKNAACRLREHCFLHPQPAHPVLRSSSLLRDSTVTLVPINDNCEEKVWRRRHNARRVLKFTRPSMIHGRATKLLHPSGHLAIGSRPPFSNACTRSHVEYHDLFHQPEGRLRQKLDLFPFGRTSGSVRLASPADRCRPTRITEPGISGLARC